MRKSRSIVAAAALFLGTALAGCGGLTVAGAPTLGLNLRTMDAGLQLTPTSCLNHYLGFGAPGINAAVLAGERMQQVAQYQARYNLASSDIRAEQAMSRLIAGRGC